MNTKFRPYRYLTMAVALALAASVQAGIEIGYGSEPEIGWGDANSVVTPYVSFPERYAGIYAGNEITGISIAVMEEASNVYVYIKNRPDDQKYIYRQKVEKLTPGWNEITLDEPFSIPEASPLAIGYKASFSQAEGVAVSFRKYTSEADNVYYNSQNRWTTTSGSICIKATVDGDALPIDRMMLFPLKVNTDDRKVSIYGEVKNVGDNDIESCKLKVSVDGVEKEILEASLLSKGGQDTYWIDFECEEYGSHTVTVQAVEINGLPVESDALNTVSSTFTIKKSLLEVARRIVCEEYTGTWCGFCPRGIVGLEMMKEKWGEYFIPIAVHGSDPMEIEGDSDSYADFIDMVSGAPYCKMNRQYGGDPYLDIESMFQLASNTNLHLAVELTCDWNEDGTSLEATTTYTSGEDIENPRYNIAYTITESGITGYPQTNYYSGGKNGEMAGWQDKTDPTFDVVYNDVARAIIGGYSGIECRYEPMEAWMPCTHSISIPLPANVADPDNIKLIAQIIDTTSGRIINAAEAVPATTGVSRPTYSQVGISTLGGAVSIDCAGREGCRVCAFSIDGRVLLDAPCTDGESFLLPPGLIIVEVSDRSGIINRKKIKL